MIMVHPVSRQFLLKSSTLPNVGPGFLGSEADRLCGQFCGKIQRLFGAIEGLIIQTKKIINKPSNSITYSTYLR